MTEIKFANYLALANQPEMSKSWLMERYLDLTEEEIQANSEGLKADIDYGFAPEPVVEAPAEAAPAEETNPHDDAFFNHATKTALEEE